MNKSDLIKGDIEIHIKSSDWYSHKHHCVPEYNNVILHVVAQHDASSATLTQNGKCVPVLCLPPEPWHQAYLMPYYQVPCFRITKCEGRQAQSLVLKQAWLLSTAALLPFQRLPGRFSKKREVQELEQAWQSIGKGAKTMSEGDWHLSHIYPNNSPVCRIIALSYLLQRYCREGLLVGMLQVVRDAPLVAGYRMLEEGLIVSGSGY